MQRDWASHPQTGGDWEMKGKIGFDKGVKRYYLSWYDEKAKKTRKIWELDGLKLYHEEQAKALQSCMWADWKRLKGSFRIEKYIKRKSDVNEFLHRWIESIKSNISYNTYYSWKGFIKNHIGPYFSKRNVTMQEVDFTMLLDFANKLPHSNIGKVTVLAALRTAFTQAKRDNLLDSVPEFPRRKDFKIQKKPIQWMPEDRVLNVIHAMPEYHQPIFAWCKYHFRRISDARALYKSDFDGDVFYIQRGFARNILVDYTKTDKVYVTPCAKAFKPYMSQMAKSFSPFYFINPEGNTKTKHYTPTAMRNILKKALKEAGEPDIPLYNFLKHSAITQASRYGISDADLAMAADISVQTLVKYKDAAMLEKKREVFDRVSILHEAARIAEK